MITYSNDKLQEAKYVAEVFKNSGIKRPYEDLERIKRMIENCDVLITAWQDEQMVGMARAITDFSYCCYLSDLAVDKEYQKHGIGKELIRRIRAEIGKECSLVLLSAPSAVPYYSQIGFDNTDRAFVIKREK